MASLEKSLSFFFFLMFFSSLQVKASGRFFFSQFSGSNNNYNAEDASMPLSYKQQDKPLPEVAAPKQAPKVVVDQKEPSFTRNQYGGYGLFGSTEGTLAATDTSLNKANRKKNNNGENFIYKMENDVNGNGKDNIWDEIKQQSLTQSREDGGYTVDVGNENKNRSNGYEGYDGDVSEKQNGFDSLEEYEKYLQRMGYLP